jgi:hypothetical protein
MLWHSNVLTRSKRDGVKPSSESMVPPFEGSRKGSDAFLEEVGHIGCMFSDTVVKYRV